MTISVIEIIVIFASFIAIIITLFAGFILLGYLKRKGIIED